MSVNKRNVPTNDVEDEIESGKPTRRAPDEPGNNLSAQTGRNSILDGTQKDKSLTDGSSNSDQNNRLRSNPNDPTERDPTRSTNKPLSGKNQP